MDKVLFWDFDGTLSHPNRSFSTALPAAFAHAGCSWDKADDGFLDTFYSWKTPHIAYPDRLGEGWWVIHFDKIRALCQTKSLSQSQIQSICDDFRARLIHPANYRLYEDTLSTLKTCMAQGYRNFLITNNYPEILDNITVLGLAPYFSGCTISSHIGYEKPRPEFFDHARALAGQIRQGFVIGDNPQADILGGKAAGFSTIAVHACTQSAADHYCPTLSQIPTLLP